MCGIIFVCDNILPQLTQMTCRHRHFEICGLLGGSGKIITHVFPATNIAVDEAKSYEIAPQELFRLIREIRAEGMTLLGIYHSHPNGNNKPSPTDIERAYYPEAAYFISTSQAEGPASVRAFSIRAGRSTELEIQVARLSDLAPDH